MNSDLLVPLDGSKAAENVLPVAAAVSAAYGLSIRFLEAVDTSQRGPTGHPDPVRSEAMFREYTEDLAARHHLDRASWHAASVVGDPAEVILAAAEHAQPSVVKFLVTDHAQIEATLPPGVTQLHKPVDYAALQALLPHKRAA